MFEQRYRSDSFVVRIWRERDDDPAAWRGWVQHAASGEARYFHCVADLLAFIEAHTNPLRMSVATDPDQESTIK